MAYRLIALPSIAPRKNRLGRDHGRVGVSESISAVAALQHCALCPASASPERRQPRCPAGATRNNLVGLGGDGEADHDRLRRPAMDRTSAGVGKQKDAARDRAAFGGRVVSRRRASVMLYER